VIELDIVKRIVRIFAAHASPVSTSLMKTVDSPVDKASGADEQPHQSHLLDETGVAYMRVEDTKRSDQVKARAEKRPDRH